MTNYWTVQTACVLGIIFQVFIIDTFASTVPTVKVVKERPRNVTAEVVNNTNVLLSWVPPRRNVNECDVSRYIIRYKTDDSPRSATRKVNGGKRSYLLTRLQSDSLYLIRLVAVSCNGKTSPTRWIRVRTGVHGPRTSRRVMAEESNVPAMPRVLRTRTTSSSITLSWEPPDDSILVRGYVVGHGEGVPDVKWQYVDSNTRSFTITELRSATQYVISLRAFNNYGKGPVIYDIVYTRDDEAPTNGPLMPPIGLRSNVLSPHTVWLEWIDPSIGRNQQVSDERYYVVHYQPVPYGSETTTTCKASNIVLYDLSPATTYEFRVKTIKGNEATVYGISVYNTTFDDAPSSPPTDFSLAPADNDPNAVHLMWMPPVQPNGALTGYLVLMSEDPQLPDREWTVDSIVSDRLSATIDSLQPNITYFFKIQARNNIGYGPHSDILQYRVGQKIPARDPLASVAGAPVTPATPPSFTDETTTVFQIIFDNNDITSGRKHNNQKQPQQHHTQGNINTPGSAAKYINLPDRPLPQSEENSKYSMTMVHSESNMGDNDLYRPDSFEVDDLMSNNKGTLPARDTSPVIFTTEVRHTVSAVITWSVTSADECDEMLMVGAFRRSSSLTSYQIEYYPDGKPELTVSVNTTKNVLLLTGLQPDTRYRYTVHAYGEGDSQPQWSASDMLETSYKN